jgi:long-chain fatty acid transport protein
MTHFHIRAVLVGAAMAVTVTSAAQAGGFGRGTADTDILFEPGNFAARAGVTFVNPSREFSSHFDPGLVGKDYTESYAIPSVAFKAQLFDPLSCAGTYTQPYGGNVNYEGRLTPGKLTEKFNVDEYALTCSVKFGVGPGNFYVLGGAFAERFEYDRVNSVIPGIANADLGLSGNDYGYRLGIAYDIPEIALRTQLLYRSSTSYGADGDFSIPALGVATGALGEGNLPQSLELKVQSGIAPGWLAFGSVKWTDWSVQQALVVSVPGFPPANSRDIYNWKDGWTVTGGVGHVFNDTISGLASITWDQGVGTGWDLSSDTWTLALGGSAKVPMGGEFRAGVGISYLTSAEEEFGPGAGNAVDSGWAYALNVGYKLSF